MYMDAYWAWSDVNVSSSVQDQEPFFLVMIDGDGMVFEDPYLRQGEQGGKDAANQLWAAVREYSSRSFSSIRSPKIVTRIYANVKGLAEACFKAGLVERPSLIEDFVRGFNGSRLLFDFVDVGGGKDRADDKIAGRLVVKADVHSLPFVISHWLTLSVPVRIPEIEFIQLSLSPDISWVFSRQWLCPCSRRFVGRSRTRRSNIFD